MRTKKRVADHGEVFTPSWLVETMIDQVSDEADRIDSRFLEPACGSGNFLTQVLKRKLDAVTRKFERNIFENNHYALLALMCTYGIELLEDNIAECKVNMLNTFTAHIGTSAELQAAARYVLTQNLVHGDALTMRANDGDAITFAEWGYLGKGRFMRRDFRLQSLAMSSSFSDQDSLFAHVGKHELFTPIKVYPVLTIRDMCELSQVPTKTERK